MSTSTDNATVLSVIAESPSVRKVLDDRARQSIAGRETLRAQLVAMEDKSEREYPAKLAKRERLLKAAKDAEAAAKAAAVALARFTAESATASLEYTRTHEEIVGRLRAGANNVLIDAFIAEMKDDMAATRKAVRSVERAKTNARTGRSSMVIDSNGDSVATRMLALAEALRQAEELRLVPDQTQVPDLISRIRASLPAVRMLVIDGDGDAI